jgi:chemotaxis response regulator CheB
VAPTDRHLLVEPRLVRVSRGPREHVTRPAIDPLFRSAACAYGARVIGAMLSGGDSAAGLDTIKWAGLPWYWIRGRRVTQKIRMLAHNGSRPSAETRD